MNRSYKAQILVNKIQEHKILIETYEKELEDLKGSEFYFETIVFDEDVYYAKARELNKLLQLGDATFVVRTTGNYKGKGIYLNDVNLNWTLEEDNLGFKVLVPRIKK